MCGTVSICLIEYAYSFIVIDFVLYFHLLTNQFGHFTYILQDSWLILGQTAYQCPGSIDGILKDMDKMDQHQTQRNTMRYELFA